MSPATSGGQDAAGGKSVKPGAVSPSAELIRDRRFSTAMIAVSSTSCASLRCWRSASTIASVTRGGVAVIAGARITAIQLVANPDKLRGLTAGRTLPL